MSARLIEKRMQAGMSVPQAAAAIGVDRRTLAKCESGARVHPSKEKLIAEYWGFDPTKLWPVSAERSVA